MPKLLVITLVVVAASALVVADHVTEQAADDSPVAVFAELDGTWSGTFVGWDATGRELYRIRVRQTYETIDETTQRVTIEDRMPDGTVITGRGENTAHRRADGGLELRCVVRKSNGDQVEHRGRLVTGPGDDEQLIWFTNRPGRTETFREVVHGTGPAAVYEINGTGRYGETIVLMHGRYAKEK